METLQWLLGRSISLGVVGMEGLGPIHWPWAQEGLIVFCCTGFATERPFRGSEERARKEVPDGTCSLFITLSWV